tara:strand:+ start:3993 stop:4496 length:504 start_codon:yes stop_codon:yes gene_type:complete
MLKFFSIFLIIFQSFIFGLDVSFLKDRSDENYRYSIGFLNERLGFNLFNISYVWNEKKNTEFFASFGTSIMISGIGIGWKRYYNNQFYTMHPFSVITILQRYGNKMVVTNGSAIRTDNCISVSGGLRSSQFELFNRIMNLQLGFFSNIDFRNDLELWPFINIEFKIK